MPSLPLKKWNPSDDDLAIEFVEESVPVLYGSPGFVKQSDCCHLRVDIFGSIFFMLSRYEEIVIQARDHLSRFPVTAAIAYNEQFLHRPIVDEYIDILFACMKQLWPELRRKQSQFKPFISCDLDIPFDPYIHSLAQTLRQSASYLLKKKSISGAFESLKKYLLCKLGFQVEDHYRSMIDFVMDVNEKAGNTVAFYFISYKTSRLDGLFEPDTQQTRALFREINQRGHEIGLHPGFNTYDNYENFEKSVKVLRHILNEEGIEQNFIGGRQHYLKWDAAQTPQLWEKYGLDYDSTLCFAECAGYRCGTSREYNMYDLTNRKKMHLKQRPLQLMETTIIDEQYEALGYTDKAIERFNYFKSQSKKHQVPFTLLWHNSHFKTNMDKEIYKVLIGR